MFESTSKSESTGQSHSRDAMNRYMHVSFVILIRDSHATRCLEVQPNVDLLVNRIVESAMNIVPCENVVEFLKNQLAPKCAIHNHKHI